MAKKPSKKKGPSTTVKKMKTAAKTKAKIKAKKADTGSCSCGSACCSGTAADTSVYHGLYASVDPATGVFTEANYSKGTLQGEYTEYYDLEAEVIKTRGRFEGGKKEGQWISYGKDGKASKVESYRQGKKTK